MGFRVSGWLVMLLSVASLSYVAEAVPRLVDLFKKGPKFQNCPVAGYTVDSQKGIKGAHFSFDLPVCTGNDGQQLPTKLAPTSLGPGSLFPIGTSLVVVTAVDADGDVASCKFPVTVLDTQPPTIIGCPRNKDVVLRDSGRNTLPSIVVSAMDNSGSPPVIREQGDLIAGAEWRYTTEGEVGKLELVEKASDGYLNVGKYDVSLQAKDAAGNHATCTFTLNFKDSLFSGSWLDGRRRPILTTPTPCTGVLCFLSDLNQEERDTLLTYLLEGTFPDENIDTGSGLLGIRNRNLQDIGFTP